MKLSFVSNYFNHHQRPLCDAFATSKDVDFVFYQTEPMEEERVRMGWGTDISEYPYVKLWQDDVEAARKRILDSDVVIWGGVEMEEEIEPRLQAGKLTFRYSERLYKEGQWKFISPRGLKKKYHDHTQYRKSPVYLLCAGAYVGSDFNLIRAYPKKKFMWGYFPETKHYDKEELLGMKSREGEPLRLLWAGRMISWKHPELAVETAEKLMYGDKRFTPGLVEKLKEQGGFTLTMAGGGEMEEELRRMVKDKGLEDVVHFTGFMKPGEIRAEMEKADIFLFTSDGKEGWGAVLNEAMNSGCLVITGPEPGAVPYMIQHGRNGMLCIPNAMDFACMAFWVASEREDRHEQAWHAYETVTKYWNAENAAAQFLRVAREILDKGSFTYAEEDNESRDFQPMCRDREVRPAQGGRLVHRR